MSDSKAAFLNRYPIENENLFNDPYEGTSRAEAQEFHSEGYEDGAKAERERIWDEVKKMQEIAEFQTRQRLAGAVSMRDIQTIIFGETNE